MRALLFIAVAAAACGDVVVTVEDACDQATGTTEVRAQRAREGAGAGVAVFARSEGQWILCSGVLVGPRTVMTAAHCVHDRGDWVFEVHFTPDLLSGRSSIGVSSTREHPTQDLAVLVLEGDAPGDAEALPWSGRQLGSEDVQDLRVTGYGGPEGDVTRCLRVGVRVQDLSVDPYRANGTRYVVLLDGRAWPGDSGGPSILEQDGGPVLVGIHSGVTPGEVTNGTLSFIERLGREDPWILEAMEAAPTEIP